MSTGRPDSSSVRRLMKLTGMSGGGPVSDRELVERFVKDRSEGAFADLMARHGPMVLAVCRRHLRDPHAADDAFQATFIVLARRAGAVRWRESIGGWLFEVATRVVRKAAARGVQRSARGDRCTAAPEPAAPAPADTADLTALQHALDEELRNLTEKLRTPIVLCHLEGLRKPMARHLGISDGQLRGRLYRAKERLRERLLRRGFTLPAVLLALAVAPGAEGVPSVLTAATLRLVSAPGPIPPAVHYLALGVIREMPTTLKAVAAVALFGALGLVAAGFAVRAAQADPPTPPPTIPVPDPRADARPAAPPDRKSAPRPGKAVADKDEQVWCTLKNIDAKKNVLRVQFDSPPEPDGTVLAFPDTDVELGAKTVLLFAFKEIQLTDLRPGMRALLVYPPDPNRHELPADVLSKPFVVCAEWPRQSVQVTATDAAKGTLTFLIEGAGGIGFPVTLDVGKNAPIIVDGLSGELEDVPFGPKVSLELSLDQKSIATVDTGPIADVLPGVVRTFDPVTRTLLVEVDADSDSGKRPVTLSLPVKADAKIRMQTWGKPGCVVQETVSVQNVPLQQVAHIKTRVWSRSDVGGTLETAKLSDLAPNVRVRLKLSADRKEVIEILAAPKPVSL